MTLTDYHIITPHALVIVISGPSGVGKDAVLNRMKDRGLDFHFVITATTRRIRDGEIDGKDYFFISSEAFTHMIESNELLEHAIVYNDYKGIPKQQVRDALASGRDVILRIDVQGAASIKKLLPEAILIFLTTENEKSMVDRLSNRETETPEGLNLRVATARQEVKKARDFDYVVINYESELDRTVDVISAIITAEHHKVIQRNVVL